MESTGAVAKVQCLGHTHTVVRIDAGEFNCAIMTSFGVFFIFFMSPFWAVSISKAIVYQVHL